MTTMQTASDYFKAAKSAVLAGNLDESEQFLKQGQALKAVEAEIATNRPAFGETDAPPSGESAAVKTIEAAYVKKFGTIDAGVNQVYRELYGTQSYPVLLATKMADLNRYCKTGVADGRLMKQVLLTQEQIVAAVMDGVPVAEGQYNVKATMVEAQDTLLGYIVPEQLNQEMVQRLPGLTVVRGLARKFTTGVDSLSFIVRTGGNKRYIGNARSKQTSESPTSTYNTNATFGKLIIPVHVNLFKVPVSKSGLEDSQMDVMGQLLMPEIQTEGAITEDAQFLVGTGANEPQGVLLDASTGGPQNSDITTQNSGQAADVSFDAVVRAPWKLAGQYRQKQNPSTAFAFTSATGGVLATLKNSVGEYLWTEANGANAQGSPDTLRGWKYRESEALPEIAANTFPIIFGDWSGYRIVDRVGMSIQRYDDSNTAETDSVVFFVRRRYGGQVAEGYRFVAIKCAAPLN